MDEMIRVADLERYVGTAEAGRIGGISGVTVRQLIQVGKLRAVKTRLGSLIDPHDIDEYIAARNRRAAARAALRNL